MTEYQQQDLEIRKLAAQAAADRAAAAAEAARVKAATPSKDVVAARQLYDQATTPAQVLTDWYGQNRSPNMAAATLGRLPVVGNLAATTVDADFANAKLAAHNLAVTYLESQPKARFQPSSIAQMEKLIAPDPGDDATQRAQKLKTIQTLKRALARKAQYNPLEDNQP
jgi:hypothetical protein